MTVITILEHKFLGLHNNCPVVTFLMNFCISVGSDQNLDITFSQIQGFTYLFDSYKGNRFGEVKMK